MKDTFLGRVIFDLVQIFFKKRVTRSAAELSYFLTLSFFPFFICLYWFVRMLNIDLSQLLLLARGVVPEEAINALGEYLGYVSDAQSTAMLIGGILLMATSSSGAFRSILNLMDDIYSRRKLTGILGLLASFVWPFVFLVTVYVGIILLVTGGWFLSLLDHMFGIGHIVAGWSWLRFLFMFLFILGMIYGLYRFIAPRAKPRVPVIYGSLFTAFALVAVSILFSWFISMSTRYELVYGSLASFVILMVWLYLCGNIILLGSILNYVLSRVRAGTVGPVP